ncbi:hypothetical protein [Endozoicomonas lisbonensis]|uniref:hypothetical protein n=1 Tax=Endozoicomonas lisbonensis TaxID=3120522 RepID=UPI00339B9553
MRYKFLFIFFFVLSLAAAGTGFMLVNMLGNDSSKRNSEYFLFVETMMERNCTLIESTNRLFTKDQRMVSDHEKWDCQGVRVNWKY